VINPKTNQRELAYVVEIADVQPIEGYDRVEEATISGWHCVVGKGDFKPGDKAIYFEIDSQLPADKFADFEFLAKKHFKVKTQKMCKRISQGLLLTFEQCGLNAADYKVGDFLTDTIGVTYADPSDNIRKGKAGSSKPKYNEWFTNKLKKYTFLRKIVKNKVGQKICSFLFRAKRTDGKFPTHFQYIKKTDQERIENMPWVLNDETPYIVTQKCDGSSATYILEKKKGIFGTKYEFYVCSRNVRLFNVNDKFYHDTNYYWECAIKYDIENKLRDYLDNHPDLDYICWQGEICAPAIQKNPHHLKETHLYLFHMIDSKIGKWDIRSASNIWKTYDMETVPIDFALEILPDTLEEFKKEADGFYDPSVCEGQSDCPREGFVYYKTSDPNFSFKNVSSEYLLKR